MTAVEETIESAPNHLCKACGLCCTGHLFIWTKLRSSELDSIEELGVRVFRSVPSQRGFNQPCPLWQGECTIYRSPSYPRFCRTYTCSLLRKLLDGTVALPEALRLIEQTKQMIHELEPLLSESLNPNFRERLVSQLESLEESQGSTSDEDRSIRETAVKLLGLYEDIFGVSDILAGSHLE